MIKAVTTSLSLFLLLNLAVPLQAQLTPAEVAEEEAVRRQAAIQLLHMKLQDAQNLQRAGRHVEAAKVYEDAFALFPSVGLAGGTVEQNKNAVVEGLAQTRLVLAQEARKRGSLLEADDHVKRALKVAPQNPAALQFKLELDKAIAASKGNVPSQEALAQVPEIQGQKIQTSTLVQDGKLLFEMGKIDDAEIKLKQAVKENPDNKAAWYYLNLIKEHRFNRERTKREIASKEALVEVEKAWAPSVKRELLPVPNPEVKSKLVHTSPGRQEIVSKLERIRINEVGYDGLPLGEVLKHLTDESIKRDPDQEGINFVISPHSDVPLSAPAPSFDPNAPPLIIEQTTPGIDLSSVTVKLSPPLRNLRLADVLDAIVKVADQPIKYTIEDYAIYFSPKVPEPATLYTRKFAVDPNTFMQGLESVSSLALGDIQTGTRGGGGGQSRGDSFNIPRVSLTGGSSGAAGATGVGGSGLNFVTRTQFTASVNDIVKQYFAAAGVNLDPPKSVFFNDRTGILLVRATLQDLEIIATAVEALNIAPPQVTIEAKFAEISQSDNKALGFDWFLGNTLMFGDKVGGQAGTAPSFSGAPTKANPSGIFPGPGFGPGIPGPGTILPSASDGFLTAGLNRVNGSTPALATVSGILTDPQFRMVIRALETRRGVDLLTAPRVTTLSGRQTQIASVDLQTIVTGVEINQTASSSAAQVGQVAGGGGIGSEIEFQTQPLPFGPVLDVIPYVSADGVSIQMTIIPTITEFVGYDDPSGFIPQAQSVGSAAATPLSAQLPLPRLRLRQVTTSCNVWDGQTVVLGGLMSDDVVRLKDKIPVLGDIPMIGRLFRSESSQTFKKNLVIFVTPRIIDPAGNPVHSDEDLPFARNTIPDQTFAPAAQ